MIENRFYGVLTEEMHNTSDENEMFIFLIQNKIIAPILPLTHIKTNKTNEKAGVERIMRVYINDIQYDYSTNLLSEIHSFLINVFFINAMKVNLKVFNDKITANNYGLSKKKKRNYALKQFDNLFFEIISDKSPCRLQSLHEKRKLIVQKLSKKSLLIDNYLYGNIDFFTRELIDTDPLLLEIFEFENKLFKIIDINNKFKFEEDNIFTPKSISQKIFEKYEDEFDSLKQIEFIEYQIKLKEKTKRADIVSLFDFFSNRLNIKTPSGKVFGEIINSYFDFNFSKIKLNSSESTKHFKNIEKLKKDWENFTN